MNNNYSALQGNENKTNHILSINLNLAQKKLFSSLNSRLSLSSASKVYSFDYFKLDALARAKLFQPKYKSHIYSILFISTVTTSVPVVLSDCNVTRNVPEDATSVLDDGQSLGRCILKPQHLHQVLQGPIHGTDVSLSMTSEMVLL